ncbi:class I SAM-dependent methyltransferase [Okeania sp. SIO1F9]|uniref:class I SAM-dependent methyltransferase n=1 Tax=Okeania sp. SIO1F9 TaxID=2607813 RepID=UPI00257E4B33|nr:class I SAM-dependent methyltransferase [Okeania sp. SIO1F9]
MLTSVSESMQFEGMTSAQGLTLMNVFLQKVKTLHNTGLCLEFGTYKGRTAALIAKSLNDGNWLHAVEQAEYLEFDQLLKISQLITWHKERSEIFVTESLPPIAEKQKIIYTHHDASHYFNNVYTELSNILKYMELYGIMILDDFNDVYSQVRAAYYYLRYKLNFPYELLLVGFNKAILVREELFDYWEQYVLDDLLNDMAEGDFWCKLYRTDINNNSRSFYIKERKKEEEVYYGLNIWGDRFYKRSANFLK